VPIAASLERGEFEHCLDTEEAFVNVSSVLVAQFWVIAEQVDTNTMSVGRSRLLRNCFLALLMSPRQLSYHRLGSPID